MMQQKLSVGVIFGGRSGEHDVSLNSARSILAALDPHKYSVTQIGITQQGVWLAGKDAHDTTVHDAFLRNSTDGLTPVTILPDPNFKGVYTAKRGVFELFAKLDVVFPVLHGTFGEDGTLQGLLELNDIAYVGAGVVGSAVSMDKAICKDVLRSHAIPVIDWKVILRAHIEQDLSSAVQAAEQVAPYPLFVKPANLGSSVGISKCHNHADLLEGLIEAARYDRRVIVERGISAREIEIGVLGNENPQISVAGEIIPSREFYSYEAKYLDDRSELLIPAALSADLERDIREYALRAYQVTDCAGMARVDFLLDKDTGGLYLSELNTIPGFTKISMYPKVWEASGVSYTQLVDRLIQLALERKAQRQRTLYSREDLSRESRGYV